jgi:hypothetical protein
MTQETLTIEQYIEAVENALQYWLDVHTIAEKWAEERIIDDDAEYTFKESPVIKNNYFTFDWKKSALRQMAENQKHLYNVCPNCGCINEDGYEDCCEEPEAGEEPSVEELMYWFDDIEAIPDERALLDSLENEGFKVYQEALGPIIAPVVDEVNEVLNAIRSAETPEDTLRAVLWGTRVYHVHGNIMSDYSDKVNYEVEIDYKLFDEIRNNGLESVFSREDIETYLKGE